METVNAPALPIFRRYANVGGHSGVAGYAMVDSGIAVQFVDGAVYLYDRDCPGPLHVARMKALARAGSGLATYISRRIGRRYSARLDRAAANAAMGGHQATRQKTAFR